MLLDTHVLLWHEQGDRRLGPKTRRAVERALPESELAISAISFWEIGMRIQKGQLEFLFDLDAWRRELLDQGLVEIPADGVIAAGAGLLADLHGDPADRLIVATALQGCRLVTADRRILEWPGQLSRLDATN